MNSGIYYNTIITLKKESEKHSFPSSLREIIEDGEIRNVDEFLGILGEEIILCHVDSSERFSYLTTLCDLLLSFSIYRKDFDNFKKSYEIVDHKIAQILPEMTGDQLDSWKSYLSFLQIIGGRINRERTWDEFETFIDEMEWDEFPESIISRLSGFIGFTLCNEKNSNSQRKGKFWLQKAEAESSNGIGIHHSLLLARIHLKTIDNVVSNRTFENILTKLGKEKENTSDRVISRLVGASIRELEIERSIMLAESLDENFDSDGGGASLKEMEFVIRKGLKSEDTPVFSRLNLMDSFVNQYFEILVLDKFPEGKETLKFMIENGIKKAFQFTEQITDSFRKDVFRITQLNFRSQFDEELTEKEVKEVLGDFKKSSNHSLFIQSINSLSNLFLARGNKKRAFENNLFLFKEGAKDIEHGGLEKVIFAMDEINKIVLAETFETGVSWVVDEIETYFNSVTEVISEIENKLDLLGTNLFNDFRKVFHDIQQVCEMNVKVYFRYQYTQVYLLYLSSLIIGDEFSAKISKNLYDELSSEKNPLSFIKADWDEFKNVPNSVRNKVINRCISISKGDLPMAAEHLNFSYRNLRSYITFNEVNRLGFFLSERTTNNRQLEEGIRLVLHDLYKNGTIFEVIFDMPKFLVNFSEQDFSSQDMEEFLAIKGTTAKKYIKIMIEIELVEYVKSVGRKHFYKLRKDRVMNRLAKNQIVLASDTK